MADAAPKPQRPKKVKKQKSDATGTAPTSNTPPTPKRKRRGPNPWPRGVRARRFLHKEIKKELKRDGVEGPKVAVQQRVSSTFGLIGANSSGNVELELNFFCHPSLAKEPNDGTAFGPLQALAAQYALWKLQYLTLKFTPMVGASAVSGTVIRASLNLSQSPGGTNWSGLGTRIHIDTHPGRPTTFHLRGSQIGGPRDGGWWLTDTNEEGSQSAGPIIEIHTLGKTLSTFKDEDWTGPLFLVEGFGLWQFANYQVKPALGALERRTGDATVVATAEAGAPITLELDSANEIALFMDSAEPEVLATPVTNNVGETVFQVVDVGAKMAEQFAPPPFSWLIKGGWWFVKKLLGRGRTGKSTYAVYASLADAQNNKPAICTSSLDSAKTISTQLMVTQINNPNVGPNVNNPSQLRATPVSMPFGSFRLHAEMISELLVEMPKSSGTAKVAMPVSLIPGDKKQTTGSNPQTWIKTPWWIGAPGRAPDGTSPDPTPGANTGGYLHAVYRLINPRFTDQSGQVEYIPPQPMSGVNFCMASTYSSTQTLYAEKGKVVATSLIQSGTSPPLTMVLTLIKTNNVHNKSEETIPSMFYAVADNRGNVKFTLTPNPSGQSSNWTVMERSIPNNQYLLAVTYTNTAVKINSVDIPTFLKLDEVYERTESPLAPIFPYNLAGQMLPATSADVRLLYIDKLVPDLKLMEQLSLLNIVYTAPHEAERIHDEAEASLAISSDDGSESDSEDQFWYEVGSGLMPTIPERWKKNGKLADKLRPV